MFNGIDRVECMYGMKGGQTPVCVDRDKGMCGIDRDEGVCDIDGAEANLPELWIVSPSIFRADIIG